MNTEENSTTEEEEVTLLDRINAVKATAHQYSKPTGSLLNKCIVYKGTHIPFEMRNVGESGLILSLGVGVISKIITEEELLREEEIIDTFKDQWCFPWYQGTRPAIGEGYLKIIPEREDGKKLFFAEGFVNVGTLQRVVVFEDSKGMAFEAEPEAFKRQLEGMDKWRASENCLHSITKLFGVETDHINTEV